MTDLTYTAIMVCAVLAIALITFDLLSPLI